MKAHGSNESHESSNTSPGAVMQANGSPSPESAEERARGTSAAAGRHRVWGWRPRTTRAKAGLAAVAAVGATGLALALVAGPAGASTKPVWAMTAGNVQSLSAVDSSAASYFFNTAAAYGAGASLVKTPVQAHYATTPVLSYTSYAQFQSDLTSGAITFPYKWVMYDPENWTATPLNEQQDPVKYMTLFGQLAHAHGLKVIQAPALDLATVTGSVLARRPGEAAGQWVGPGNIARETTARGRYAWMFNTTESQARAANSNVLVFSEVSTVDGTAAQMAAAARSITP